MTGLRYFIFGVTAFSLSTSIAVAQDYRSWDRNNDGVIARSEWRGALQEFRERDWNNDGVLSGAELRDRLSDPTSAEFNSLDRNGDGRLNRGEWRGDRAAFFSADRNNDNMVSRAEYMNMDAGYGDQDITNFDALDVNNNNRIERGEWSGTRIAFNRLDLNRDGTLTRRELDAGERADAAVAGYDEFDARDGNNNGVISRGEWREGAAAFNRFDVNNDGVISRREYTAVDSGSTIQDTVIVNPRQPWTDSGTYVNAGDVVTFRSDGTIQLVVGGDDRATPAGSLSGRRAANSPRPDQPAGALLVRVGNGNVEALGPSNTFTARSNGRIYFGVNDDHFDDNSGEYRVHLTVDAR
jgi:Ca2+-binding EF-hand superfamily protein